MKKYIFLSITIFFLFINLVLAEEKNVTELEPIVITPWRVEELAANVSKNTSVTTEDDINRTSAKYLYEAVKDKAGVTISEQLGNPKGTVMDIRGFGEASTSNVLVLLDGRRTNQIDLSGVDWGQIDLHSVEQVEIIKGPSTVLYGDNATGGLINVITKKKGSKKLNLDIGSELGSHKYHKEYGNLSGSIERANYFFNYSHTQTNGYRANNAYWANDYFCRTNVNPLDDFNLGLSLGYHRDRYGMPGALYLAGNPFATMPKGLEQVGRRGTAFPDDRGYTQDIFATVEPEFSFTLGDHDIIASMFGSFRQRRNKSLNIPEENIWMPHSEYETIHHIKTFDLRPKTEFDLSFFDSKLINKLTLGSDLLFATDQILSGNRLTGQDQTTIQKDAVGLYLHDSVRVSDRLLFNAGGRGEWADYTFDQEKIVTGYSTASLKNAAYEFGSGYKYSDFSQVYINYSRSYRNPNTEEFYQNRYLNTWTGNVEGGLNAALKAQKGDNIEIGVKDATFKPFRINADYFWMKIKDEIYYDPATFTNSNYTPETIHRGFEVESALNLFNDILNPYVNLTLQEAYFKGGQYADNLIPLVPKVKVGAGILFIPYKGLEWSFSGSYVGSRFKVSDQNNIAPKLKPYATFDTKLSYTWCDFTIYSSISNLFNEKYYGYAVTNSTGTAETFYPAQERSFEAGAAFKF
ncbi:MAG: TonB-dependent receptor [Candidatus Omnitrophota bacterium]